MSEGYIQSRDFQGESRCEFERALKGGYCGQKGVIRLDGSTLCQLHADRLRLEERVTYWRAMLAHVELWSVEAGTRGRVKVVRLLQIERTRVSTALGRASEELEELEKSPHGEVGSGDGRAPPPWPPLLLLGLLMSSAVSG